MSSTAVEIRLNAHYDPKPMAQARSDVESLKRSTDSARGSSLFRSDRAQSAGLLNLSRQTSDIFTQGVSGTSPFTILIQQGPQIADILLSGALSAGKFAGALGALGVGVAGVMGAVSAYNQMSEAINDAATAQEKLNKGIKEQTKELRERGIAPGSEPEAIRKAESDKELAMGKRSEIYNQAITDARKIYEDQMQAHYANPERNKAPVLSEIYDQRKNMEGFSASVKVYDDMIEAADTLIAEIKEGLTSRTGGARLFKEQISPEALKGMQERQLADSAKKTNLKDVQMAQAAMNSMISEAGLQQDSPEKAQLMNGLQKNVDALNALEKAIIDYEGFLNDDQINAAELIASNGEFKKGDPAIGQEAIAARQRIGGMANAPIFSNFQKQTDLLRQIATQTQLTAQNTARTAPPAATIGAPMGWSEFQANRMTN